MYVALNELILIHPPTLSSTPTLSQNPHPLRLFILFKLKISKENPLKGVMIKVIGFEFPLKTSLTSPLFKYLYQTSSPLYLLSAERQGSLAEPYLAELGLLPALP